jgi:hypothetical protein
VRFEVGFSSSGALSTQARKAQSLYCAVFGPIRKLFGLWKLPLTAHSAEELSTIPPNAAQCAALIAPYSRPPY